MTHQYFCRDGKHYPALRPPGATDLAVDSLIPLSAPTPRTINIKVPRVPPPQIERDNSLGAIMTRVDLTRMQFFDVDPACVRYPVPTDLSGFSVITPPQVKCALCSCVLGGEESSEPDSYEGEMMVLCADCDAGYDWCELCRTRVDLDDPCRHSFWSAQYESFQVLHELKYSESKRREAKEAIVEVVKILSDAQLDALAEAIRAHAYQGSWRGEARIMLRQGPISVIAFDLDDPDDIWPDPDLAKDGAEWLLCLWAGTSRTSRAGDDDTAHTPEYDLMVADWLDEVRAYRRKYPSW